MSVLDQIRKLDEQKAQLIEGAKKEGLDLIHQGIAVLAEIGFTYRVVEGGQPTQSAPRVTGTRRAGVRDQVLSLVTANPGITRSALIAEMNIKGNKSAEQSLSNALAALKKGGQIDNPDGNYTAL